MRAIDLFPWVLAALAVCACVALIVISWSIGWSTWKDMRADREKKHLRRIEEGYRR